MLKNCVFGTYRATATKASSLSITSANLQPSEFVYRSRDSRKLRLNRDDREPGSGSWISSWATRLVWIWAPHKVTASNLIRATRDCWPKALKSSGVLRPPSSGRYTRRIQPSQAEPLRRWMVAVRSRLPDDLKKLRQSFDKKSRASKASASLSRASSPVELASTITPIPAALFMYKAAS